MRTAMTCPVGRHESAILRSPPTDPTGFIYPTYRAALTETQINKPSPKTPHQGVAYVSSSVGGSLSILSFEDTTFRNYWNPPISFWRRSKAQSSPQSPVAWRARYSKGCALASMSSFKAPGVATTHPR